MKSTTSDPQAVLLYKKSESGNWSGMKTDSTGAIVSCKGAQAAAGPSGPAASRTVPGMTLVVAAGCFVLGLLVGSFLNVVIHRVPRKESVIRPRSRCPGCNTQLAERDNVPVLSWLLLKGRCRTCGMQIPARYPLVELGTAVAFAAVGAHFGADWALPAFLLLTASLIAVSAVDLELFLVPNRILLATLALGVPLLALAASQGNGWSDVRGMAVGAVVGYSLLQVINLISPRGMGMGDVKLAGVLGLFLGYIDVGHVLLGLFLGFVLGSVGGVVLIVTGIRTRKQHIPFAPYLAAGALLAVFVGKPILDWYSG